MQKQYLFWHYLITKIASLFSIIILLGFIDLVAGGITTTLNCWPPGLLGTEPVDKVKDTKTWPSLYE